MRKLLHFLLLCGFVINFSCSVSDESQQKSVNEERQQKSVNEERHHASAEQETDAQVRRSHHIRATVTQKATKHRRQIRWRRDDRGKWKKAGEWMEERWEGIRAGRKPIRWIVILKAVELGSVAVSPLQLGIVVDHINFFLCQLSFILTLILAYYWNPNLPAPKLSIRSKTKPK